MRGSATRIARFVSELSKTPVMGKWSTTTRASESFPASTKRHARPRSS